MQEETRSSHYCDNGKYHGVPLLNSECKKNVSAFGHERFDEYLNTHSIIDLLTRILLHTNENF